MRRQAGSIRRSKSIPIMPRAKQSMLPTQAAPSVSSRRSSRPKRGAPISTRSGPNMARWRKRNGAPRPTNSVCRWPRRAPIRSKPIGQPTAPPRPLFTGTRVFRTYDVGELVPYIDWTPFFQTWEMRGRYPAILDDEKQGEAARQLFDDAQAMLARVVEERWFDPKASSVFGQRTVLARISTFIRASHAPKTSHHSTLCASNCYGAMGGPIWRLPISSRRWSQASRIISALSSLPPVPGKTKSPSALPRRTMIMVRSLSKRSLTVSRKLLPSACMSEFGASSGPMRQMKF